MLILLCWVVGLTFIPKSSNRDFIIVFSRLIFSMRYCYSVHIKRHQIQNKHRNRQQCEFHLFIGAISSFKRIPLFIRNFNRCGLRTDAPKLGNRAKESRNRNPSQNLPPAAKRLHKQYLLRVDTQVVAEISGARPMSLFGLCLHIRRTQPWLTTQWPAPTLLLCLHLLLLRITAQVQTVGRTCPWSMRTCIPWHLDKMLVRVDQVIKTKNPCKKCKETTILITGFCTDKTN